MFVFDVNARRGYLAVLSTIAMSLFMRYLNSHDWPPSDVIKALMSDALIVLFFLLLYEAVQFVFIKEGLISKVSSAFHVTIVFLIFLLCIASTSLFIKTGEELDWGILKFFLNNIRELAGVVGATIDYNVLASLGAIFLLYVLSFFKFKSLPLFVLQNVLFAIPVVLIFSSFLSFVDVSKNQIDTSNKETNYQGIYRNFQNSQLDWLADPAEWVWRKGVISSLSLSGGISGTEYELAKEKVPIAPQYQMPSLLTHSKSRPNVLLILLESTRADMVGIYQSNRVSSLTPFLDSFAREGLIVERAYTTIPHTSKALVGIFCGTFPKPSLLPDEITQGTKLNCAPNLFGAAGYATAHFQTAPPEFEDRLSMLEKLGVQHRVTQANFVRTPENIFGYLGLDDRLLLEPTLSWMKEQKKSGKPFFASLLTILTHHPYVSPEHNFPIKSTSDALLGYKKAIAYNDGMVRDLITQMKSAGLLENTIVIITGDHGEGFGEHGQLAHNGTSYEEGLRVPLIIHYPAKIKAGSMAYGLWQHTDILPTLLSLSEISYSGVLPGKIIDPKSPGHDFIVGSCFYQRYCLAGYDANGGKLIYYYGRKRAEYFDLRKDTSERVNLIEAIDSEKLDVFFKKMVQTKESYDAVYQD